MTTTNDRRSADVLLRSFARYDIICEVASWPRDIGADGRGRGNGDKMIYKCQNCGGNVIYSPEKGRMFCPYCESEESQELQTNNEAMDICPNCGGQVPDDGYTSATQCPYCSNYLIFDPRVEGEYLPKMLIPFLLGKETCKKTLRDKFEKAVFIPTDFLSEVRLNGMEGDYVPFWFYDYDVNMDFQGEGTKTRSWVSGNMSYTETSYYDVQRDMDVAFRDIPADASLKMPDDVMDLMEPYDYAGLIPFDPKYMSGFHAERYNMRGSELENRARQKMTEDTNGLLKEQIKGYGSMRTLRSNLSIRDAKETYGLLPVWKYMYRYQGKDYPFYVNGQTGKIVGTAPISLNKVWGYTATLWACLTTIVTCVGILFTIWR